MSARKGPKYPNPRKQRRACIQCTRRTSADSQVCWVCVPPNSAKRPEVKCSGCSKVTASKSGKCRECMSRDAGRAKAKTPEAKDALKGGRWVHVRGVARWVADDQEVA